MYKSLLLLVLIVVLFGCKSTAPKFVDRRDTVVVAYKVQLPNGLYQYPVNKAIAWTHMQRIWVNDSGLDAKMGVVTQFALRLPPSKYDSIIDTTTHKLLRIIDHYQPTYLPDSLSKYIHILDTLHN